MTDGEKEIEKIGIEESAGYKNLIAIRDYTTATRTMFRNLQEENKRLLEQVKQQNLALEQLRSQITNLQIQFYQHRATQTNG